jgi:3-methyl-2-oxobutanoate hydroxymethyltransferase
VSTRPQSDAAGTPAPGKLSILELAELKRAGRPIVMVTAYDYPSGRLVDEAGVDLVLVGDSAAMTVLGHASTVPATMDEMLMLTAAVTRGCRHPLVIGDLPFLSYQVSDEDALRNAGRMLKEGAADAVKLEGAGPMLSRITALSSSGIPVMGHLGLTPQTATSLGGWRSQGRTAPSAARLVTDAEAVQDAGAFALVLECVPGPVAARITRRLQIPVIGIGAGPACDGQVLVYHDLLGLYEGRTPRFVKQYADLHAEGLRAVRQYATEVRERAFPEEVHGYAIADEELAELDADLAARDAEAMRGHGLR